MGPDRVQYAIAWSSGTVSDTYRGGTVFQPHDCTYITITSDEDLRKWAASVNETSKAYPARSKVIQIMRNDGGTFVKIYQHRQKQCTSVG